MTSNLNQTLYARFGLEIDIKRVQSGFQSHLKNILLEKLAPIVRPSFYKQYTDLKEAQQKVLKEACRQMFIDFDDYENADYGFTWFLESEIQDKGRGFNECLLRLQVLMNIVFPYDLIKHEVGELAKEIARYCDDFPSLGVMVKIYKSKAPQIFPTTSKKFKEEIESTLGVLDGKKKYEHILSHYENGLKEFLMAKSPAGYKDVIEDMYTACDELIKAVSGSSSKGFKHISDKTESAQLGLNGHQKELFKNLRNWMDEIKHGTRKDFDRDDTEMIIGMVGSLIRFAIMKENK